GTGGTRNQAARCRQLCRHGRGRRSGSELRGRRPPASGVSPARASARRCLPVRRNRAGQRHHVARVGQDRGSEMTSPYPLLSILGIVIVALTIAASLIYVERRLLALWQDRYGPNRTGPFGLLQVVADAIKIFMKEDWVPPFVDKPVFILAPAVIFVTVL